MYKISLTMKSFSYVEPSVRHLSPFDELEENPSNEGFSDYFMSKFLSDITILCDEKEIPAHKFILCSKSLFNLKM